MNCKTFSIFFLALFAFQGLSHAVPQRENKDLANDAMNALKELERILEEAIGEAKEVLMKLKEDLEAYAQQMIEQGLAQLEEEANKVIAEIQKLIDEAVEDITACVEGQIDAVKQLPISLGKELVECITDQLNEGIRIITDAYNLIEGTIDNVKNFEEAIKSCNESIICLARLIKEIGQATIDLPLQITSIVVRTQDLIATVQTDIEICAVTKVALCGVEAGKILANVIKCIAESR